jgi:hypothetical protein
MHRRKSRNTWFRRLCAPLRKFIQVDLDMTRQALRSASPSAVTLMCAPSLFVLWILDETEAAIADLRRLLIPKRTSTPVE